jgi:hypothetical protein
MALTAFLRLCRFMLLKSLDEGSTMRVRRSTDSWSSDADSSTGNKSDKSRPQEQQGTKNTYSEVVTERFYKGQNCLHFIANKEIENVLCYNELFPFFKNQRQ